MPSELRAPIAPSPLLSIQTDQTLRLLPLSDLHLPTKPASTELILNNRAYLERMDSVVLLGDMLSCYGTRREYQSLSDFLTRLKRPYEVINGNHEFYFQLIEEDSPDYGHFWAETSPADKAQKLREFQSFFGVQRLWHSETNALGHFVFLGLDGVQNEKVETFSDAQLHFLTTQMQGSLDEPTFVFCHAPLMIDRRLDMVYYDERTACVEAAGDWRASLQTRRAPLFWMSGHIHLHPLHYLFTPYAVSERAPNVWQIHCPDSWGYGRWQREHRIPQRYEGVYSRHLEIEPHQVRFVTHDHLKQQDIGEHLISLKANP